MKTSITFILSLAFTTLSIAQSDSSYYLTPTELDVFKNDRLEIAAPFLSTDSRTLYFTVADKDQLSQTGELFHEIWYSEFNNGMLGKPIKASAPFNNGDNTAIVGTSADGKRVYLFGAFNKFFENQKGLYVTNFDKESWSKPKAINIPDLAVNGGFYGFYVHPNEDVIIISIPVEDQEDLYISKLNEDNQWSSPIKLPESINSEAIEISPFLSHDKSTLYFSREDENGQTDIYFSQRTNENFEEWTIAQPLPQPINEDSFDAYFSILEDSTILFSSNRAGIGKIYFSKLINRKSLPSIRPVSLDVEPVNNQQSKGQSYFDFEVKNTSFVHFDFNDASLKKSYTKRIDRVIERLKSEPLLRVELNGHTDYIDSEAFNFELSQKRACHVAQYMMDHGISKERICMMAYGETLPISNNNSPKGRLLNRRVEINLIDYEKETTLLVGLSN